MCNLISYFKNTHSLFDLGLVCLIEALRPGQQFFSHVGTEPPLPELLTSGLGSFQCFCSIYGTGGVRTKDLSLRSMKLYH